MSTRAAPLHLISSMATKALLADLAEAWQAQGGAAVRVESVGGVDAAKRVAAGEAFDGVVLAAKAIDELAASGQVVTGSRVDLVTSGVAIAVKGGAPVPDVSTEAALKAAVLAASSVGYSTGPSGVALLELFERWGIAEQLAGKLVQAPPGVPVARQVAEGQVGLGFQQLAEMLAVPGITIVGPMPAAVQIITTFSAGVARASRRPDEVRALLAFMASAAVTPIKQRNGMDAA